MTILYEAKQWAKNKEKWKAANEYAQKNGWEFKILTEKDIKNNEHLKEYKVYKLDGTIVFMAHRLPTSKDTCVSFVNGEIMKLPTYHGDWVISTEAEINAFNEIIKPVKVKEEKLENKASLEKEIAELEKYLNNKKAERDNLYKLAMESKI